MKKTYLRFLSLSHALDSSSAHLAQVDETAKHLLELIVLRHAQGQALTVTETMAMSDRKSVV